VDPELRRGLRLSRCRSFVHVRCCTAPASERQAVILPHGHFTQPLPRLPRVASDMIVQVSRSYFVLRFPLLGTGASHWNSRRSGGSRDQSLVHSDGFRPDRREQGPGRSWGDRDDRSVSQIREDRRIDEAKARTCAVGRRRNGRRSGPTPPVATPWEFKSLGW